MKYIDNPDKMQQEVLKKTFSIAAIPVFYSLITGEYETLAGFSLGLIITALLLRLKLLNIERSLEMNEERAENFIRNRSLLEYFIYLIVLVIAIKNPELNFLAVVAGFFLMKLTVIAMAIMEICSLSYQKRMEN